MEKAISLQLGGKIRTQRIRRRWTQADLARITGLTRATIHNIEVGKHGPSIQALKRLDAVFGSPVESLEA